MNPKLLTSLVLLLLAGWAAADLPRKAPLTKYRDLWQNSPFTTKPVVTGGPPPPSILDDYALAGVSPIKGGYRVTIINKKKPDERKYVYSDQPNASHGFKIVSVEREAGDMRGTVVHMRVGSQEGTVSYDEKFLTIAAPPPVQQADQRGRQKGKPVPPNNAVIAAQNNSNQQGVQLPQGDQQNAQRPPRPRVVGPPPAPQPEAGNNNPSSEQRPNKR